VSAPDFTRTLARTDACPPVPALRLGALLYGLDDSWADRWLRQLRVSNEVRKRAVGVVKHAALPPSDIDGEALRRWVARVGRSVMPDLLEVARADERCGGPILPPLPQRAVAVLESGLPLTPAELPLDGGTLMAELGLEPGPQVGEILRWLVERVLEDPSRNDEAALRALLPAARDAIRSEA
jgi:tRNA nucleotidyltransferase (CCA-adding enzyme)